MPHPTERHIRLFIKPAVFVLCLVPLMWLTYKGLSGQMGANPIEKFIRFTGDWALRFLLITLAVTPLRRIVNAAWLLKLRRMLGLFAFFYALVHVLGYVVLDQFFAWDEIWKDIVKRPFITVGMMSFVLLIPLAATSNHFSMKRLGGQRWKNLHQLVYIIAGGSIFHYIWLVKADLRTPIIHGLILLGLLGFRAWFHRRAAAAARRTPLASQTHSG